MAQTHLLELRDARTLALPGARLLVVRGPDKGRAARIESDELVVGTAESAQLKLTDRTVSRNHLALRVSGPTPCWRTWPSSKLWSWLRVIAVESSG